MHEAVEAGKKPGKGNPVEGAGSDTGAGDGKGGAAGATAGNDQTVAA